jgi:transcriptional regulator with XRE-family HTH domain
MQDFGKNLKLAMKAKGLSSLELGESIGVTQRMIQMYLNGSKTPTYKRLVKINELLGLDTKQQSELVTEQSKPVPIPTEITQLVNSNAILAESNKKLVDMLHSTAGFQKDKDLATSAMFRGLLDGMADVATGKEYNSKSEALRGLSKQIHEYVSAILIADNHGEKGKKHT